MSSGPNVNTATGLPVLGHGVCGKGAKTPFEVVGFDVNRHHVEYGCLERQVIGVETATGRERIFRRKDVNITMLDGHKEEYPN